MPDKKDNLEHTKEAKEFMDKLDSLDSDQREHLRRLIERLVECYVNDKHHGVLAFNIEGEARADLFTVNCNEMDAAFILNALTDTFMGINLADAPEKEMFN